VAIAGRETDIGGTTFRETALGVSPKPLSGQFLLYNILGQVVLSVPLRHDNGVQAIVLPGALPSGTYFAGFLPIEQSGNLLAKTHRIVIVK